MMEICQYEIVENCDMIIKVRSELSRINLGHLAHITKYEEKLAQVSRKPKSANSPKPFHTAGQWQQ